MTSQLTIYGDDAQEALWFQSLTPMLETAERKLLNTDVPTEVESLLEYDRPDIILVKDSEPVLVLERTSMVPTGTNISQRFGRLIRAVEEGVPAVMYQPFKARKHGEHSSICWANARDLWAMSKATKFHDAPFWAIEWPSDDDGELLTDGTEDKYVSDFIEAFINSSYDTDNMEDEKDLIRQRMKDAYNTSRSKTNSYKTLPRSVDMVDTADVVDGDFPNYMNERDETIVYDVGLSESSLPREDPYTGAQFVYDYGWCRDGPSVQDRTRNLVINVTKLTAEEWCTLVDNDPDLKRSLWYELADAFTFKDTVVSDYDNLEYYAQGDYE